MKNYLYIGIGGAFGAVCRLLITRLWPSTGTVFPFGTLACNLVGCVLLGYLTYALFPRMSEQVKLMITTGFIGAFTTLSTFSMETVILLENGRTLLAFAYVVTSLIGGMGFVWLGSRLAGHDKHRGDRSNG
ncbi:fluoride efflux transporter CrcB [Paenibacillus albiflavus]|uniref:Fluoride-specific ion channel FluC n=1 Tax=Paenibacillus albiflavus TaxID=2545760 RepID=A0A4R4EMB2_9BACL|nr:fluoride efflux transporter CrcB [Paenibacillus albiflavus]TCZ79468.1 fluoride efflux transporter CrcB [Paenibacillus albiflavus]